MFFNLHYERGNVQFNVLRNRIKSWF